MALDLEILAESEGRIRLRADLTAPRAGRRAIEARLRGRVADDVLETARLLVTELVTNSVRHAGLDEGDEIEVLVGASRGRLRVEVSDPGRAGTMPQRRLPREGGWGLELLERMTSRWGVVPGPPTRVWFELDGAVDGQQPVPRQAPDPLAAAAATFDRAAASGDLLRLMLTSSRMGLAIVDRDLVVVRMDERAAALTGHRPEDVVERDVSQLLPPDVSGLVAERLRTVLQLGRADTGHEFANRQGRVYRNAYFPIIDGSEPVGVATITEDITQQRTADEVRRDAEDALRVSEALFREVADAAPVLIWMTDDTGAVTFLNQRWTALTGRPITDGLDDGWLSIVAPDEVEDVQQRYRHALAIREPFEAEYRVRCADGSWRWMQERAVPIHHDGTFSGFIASVVDVQDAKTAQEELERAHDRAVRLAEIVAQLSSARTPEEMARRVAANVRNTIGADHMGFFVTDPEGGLELAGAAGMDPDDVERWRRVGHSPGDPVALSAASGLPTYFESNAALAEHHPQMAAERGQKGREACAFFPLPGDQGVIALTWMTKRTFPVLERRFLESIAVHCAQALNRANSYRAEQDARAAAEAARERSSFIADAAKVLDASLDRAATLRAFASVCVPRLADWCVIDVANPAGVLELATVAHSDPQRTEEAREVRGRITPDPTVRDGTYSVLRTGQPVRISQITPALCARHPLVGAAEAMGGRSVLMVPLVARGHTFGVVTLVRSGGRAPFTGADTEIAREVAARAGLAMDNARLYEERSQIAWTLQKSLLPGELPELPGLETAARYRAAALDTEVGGDFYDLHAGEDGTVRVVIGDVCGKGAEAAALTSLARHTLRAIEDGGARDPAQALIALNRAVRRQVTDYRFISMALCHLRSDAAAAEPCAPASGFAGPGTLEVAVGGHPPPLVLRADGSWEVVDGPGWLLGIHDEPEMESVRVPFGPGDTLVLYTDGVTEADRRAPAEPEDLAAALAPFAPGGPEAVADALEELASRAAGGALRDDVAILVVRARPTEG